MRLAAAVAGMEKAAGGTGIPASEIQVLFQRLDKKLVEEENERLEKHCPG